jgi:carbamoyl-phosphate synthase small subunit
MTSSADAVLVLEDGTIFRGKALGAEGESIGEVVFNTAMSGYQEILTDPSYYGQMVTMTYPHIGNYGINLHDAESERPFVAGFIVREACAMPSNWRSSESLDAYLKRHGIVGIQRIDTRALTRHLRDKGAKMGVISTEEKREKILLEKVKSAPTLIGRDLVKEVTCKKAYAWTEPLPKIYYDSYEVPPCIDAERRRRLVVMDCGVKHNILRWGVTIGFDVQVAPAHSTAAEILAYQPDAVLLSNGPGDPEGVPYVIKTVQELFGKTPIFGICLGHQILGLASGGKTFKLKFGHHGANHPVKNLDNGRVEITSQNHNFAVEPETLSSKDSQLTHRNLNDGTLEGFRRLDAPIFSVQYHPEASPGPHDAGYLFGQLQQLLWRAHNLKEV